MTAKTAPIIGYLRVSTKRQGESGLGLEDQRAEIVRYAEQRGARVLDFYTEIESGKNMARPELARAISRSKRQNAALVVSKLDRLSRNVEFLSVMKNSGVEFISCDHPNAGSLLIGILIVIAQDEAKRISDRTKGALRAYKARGGLLGAHRSDCKRLTQEAQQKGRSRAVEVSRQRASAFYADLLPVMMELREGGQSFQKIADHLNATEGTTRRGAAWNKVQVMRVLSRAA